MLEISLFGGTTVRTSTGTYGPDQLGGVKPRQILEILAINPGTPVPKGQLADLLWDGRPPKSWTATLESYVCVLRRALRTIGAEGTEILTATRGYLLDTTTVRTDLAAFRTATTTASVEPAAALGQLRGAMALVTGELFPHEDYLGWAVRERAQVQGEIVACATAAARHALALGDPETAVGLARAALARDTLAEDAWRLLLQGLAAAGRRSEALRAYGDLRDVLAAELGTDPDTRTQQVYLDLLRDETQASARTEAEGRHEVKMLLSLLRTAVASVAGTAVARNDLTMLQAATHLAGAA
jgi:DNA-binding SARP family transcriptional activator